MNGQETDVVSTAGSGVVTPPAVAAAADSAAGGYNRSRSSFAVALAMVLQAMQHVDFIVQPCWRCTLLSRQLAAWLTATCFPEGSRPVYVCMSPAVGVPLHC
jgi:hypothetical protein